MKNPVLAALGNQENYHFQAQIQRYMVQADEDQALSLSALVKLAQSVGINKPETIADKIELIRAVQIATFQQPCFRSELRTTCKRQDCSWRFDCKRLVAEWCR